MENEKAMAFAVALVGTIIALSIDGSIPSGKIAIIVVAVLAGINLYWGLRL